MSGIDERRELLRDRDVDCPGCGYNLRNTDGVACPECGARPTVEQLQAPSEPRAVAALWLGVAAVLTCWLGIGLLPGIAAIVVGLSALGRIDRQGGRRLSRQQARAGAIAGGVSCVVAGLVFVAAIVLPMLSHTRTPSKLLWSSTVARGIHQSLVTFANSNNGYYPGLDSSGADVDLTVEGRYLMLLNGNYFTPEYIISPYDQWTLTEWQGGPLTSQHYSYSLLQVPAQGARRDEWFDTLNTQAPVVAERNTGTPTQTASTKGGSPWEGAVAWNDNHSGWEKSHIVSTKFTGTTTVIQDDLFQAAGDDDALLIHTGR